MRYFYTAICIIISTINLIAQKPNSVDILNSGKKLYLLEKASWYSTDHFLKNFKNLKNDIGGYLSYKGDDDFIYSIFFDKSKDHKILARYQFDKTPNSIPKSFDTTSNSPTEIESDLITIRQKTLKMLSSNDDGFFTFYENASFNPIPIIENKKRKVYLLTASQKQGTIFIGNDYLIEFNSKNKLKNKTKLHNSLIELPWKPEGEQKITATIHSHVVSDHIDPTDICTLLLYKDFVEWNQHYVIGKKYVSILDLKSENLIIMTKKAFENIK